MIACSDSAMKHTLILFVCCVLRLSVCDPDPNPAAPAPNQPVVPPATPPPHRPPVAQPANPQPPQPGFANQQGQPRYQNQPQPFAPGVAGGQQAGENVKHLYEYAECKAEIEHYCKAILDSNKEADVQIIVCLEEDRQATEALSPQCQNIVWNFKRELTQDTRFQQAAGQFCSEELNALISRGDCPMVQHPVQGHLVSCLIDHKDKMDQNKRCHQFLSRMEIIMFWDYRLIGNFVNACQADIEKHQCGRVDITDVHTHSQGATVDCLLRVLVEGQNEHRLAPLCEQELHRVAELQSDDWHLDRPLYFACLDDKDRFCSNVQAGDGRVLACLYKNAQDPQMSGQCQEKLLLREQFMARDYEAAHPLVKACQKEIQTYNCVIPQQADQQGQVAQYAFHTHLSYVIMCLENAMHRRLTVSGECTAQVFDHRRILLSDYRISPEVVMSCHAEIEGYCNNALEQQGGTLHCLMAAARDHYHDDALASANAPVGQMAPQPNAKFGAMCYQALADLMKTSDVASNYKVDPALERSCGSTIAALCQQAATDEESVMSCLMDNLENVQMTQECEDRMLEVQYFVARDWALDPALYRQCKDDAERICSATKDVWEAQPETATGGPSVDRSGMVMACLFRHAYPLVDDPQPNADNLLGKKCANEVKRVMHQRAASVRLMPSIEEKCFRDLATQCSDKTDEPGDELMCLQENYDNLEENCRDEVMKFSQMESKDVMLNRLLWKACKPVLDEHCPDIEEDEIDSLDAIECLVENKNQKEMTSKCHAYVIHYEILSMKDYRISAKFYTACKDDVQEFCHDAQHGGQGDKAARDKGDVIRCLATIMFEHKLLEGGKDQAMKTLSKQCRAQLRSEYLTWRADVEEIDPNLKKLGCDKDIQQFCPTESDKIECLRRNRDQLSAKCRKNIFKQEEFEHVDNKMDLVLMRACRASIAKHCREARGFEILHCLDAVIPLGGMSDTCLKTVKERLLEAAGDIRLQPVLKQHCANDIDRHCKQEMVELIRSKDDEVVNTNTVVSCLRAQFAKSELKLESGCREEVKRIILESELDPRLDPPFYRACQSEISRLCQSEIVDGLGHAEVVECLKTKFYEARVVNDECSNEMRRRTDEELADIHMDPQLVEACQTDIERYCRDVRSGSGRVVICLIDASRSSNVQMQAKCVNKLQDRKKMWKHVYKDKPPISFSELAQVVETSPLRNTLLTVAGVLLAVIFIVGLCCGRVTKRIRREVKNK